MIELHDVLLALILLATLYKGSRYERVVAFRFDEWRRRRKQ